MEIRRIRGEEGTDLRAIRLRAFADAPFAFGTTLAEAKMVPMEEWEERARRYSASERDAMFVAVEDSRWWGLAGGYFEEERPGAVHLISMWVQPEKRRYGLGMQLVDAVVGWARGQGAEQVELWVTEENFPARSLYRRAGFAETGEAQPLPSNPDLDEILMSKDL